MKKVNRNHFLVILDNSISSLTKNFRFIFLVIIVLYETLKWYQNTYEIKENIIKVTKGIFEKKTKEIPFNKIQTINICEGVKHRIFGLVILKIDTGNNSLDKSEISFVMKKSEAEELKDIISKFKNKHCNEEFKEQVNLEQMDKSNAKAIQVSNKELILLSLTSYNILSGTVFIFAVYNFVNKYLEKFLGKFTEAIKNGVKEISIKEIRIAKVVYIVGLILIIYLIISLMVSIISNFVKFYNFSIERQKKYLIIKYGMLNKKNYVIPVEKISALYIKQNIIKQLLGLQELHIESIGYGNEIGETSMLYPIAKKLKKQEIIKELLPEFQFNENIIKSPRRALRRFIISSLIWPSIICFILTLKFKCIYFSIFCLLIFVLKGYLEYINSGVGINSNSICLINRGFYKTVTIIPRNKIQSIVIRTNYFQRKKQVFDLIIYIQANHFKRRIRVKNVTSELKDQLDFKSLF